MQIYSLGVVVTRSGVDRTADDRASNAPGFHHQQYDAADKRERANHRGNEMTVRGFNVYAEEINRLAGRFEGDAGVRQHDDAQRDQNYCGDGFGIHIRGRIGFAVMKHSLRSPVSAR